MLKDVNTNAYSPPRRSGPVGVISSVTGCGFFKRRNTISLNSLYTSPKWRSRLFQCKPPNRIIVKHNELCYGNFIKFVRIKKFKASCCSCIKCRLSLPGLLCNICSLTSLCVGNAPGNIPPQSWAKHRIPKGDRKICRSW